MESADNTDSKNQPNWATEADPKMKFFDFGAFQIKMQMPSHEKILLQRFLGHLILPPVPPYHPM